jgi:hypothetical protein
VARESEEERTEVKADSLIEYEKMSMERQKAKEIRKEEEQKPYCQP